MKNNENHFTVSIELIGSMFQVECILVGERSEDILYFVSTSLQVSCMQLNVNLLSSKMKAYH
jgi:hypothetical protein